MLLPTRFGLNNLQRVVALGCSGSSCFERSWLNLSDDVGLLEWPLLLLRHRLQPRARLTDLQVAVELNADILSRLSAIFESDALAVVGVPRSFDALVCS